MIELCLQGKRPGEIAEKIGFTVQVVTRTLMHPEVKAAVEEERGRRLRAGRIRGEATITLCIETLEAALLDGDVHARIKAAIALLDRFGLSPSSAEAPEPKATAEPTPDDVRAILRRLPRHVLAEVLAERDSPVEAT